MRLVDRVVNAPAEISVRDSEGREHFLPGVGYHADAIRDCPLRYMLDEWVSRECIRLMMDSQSRLFDAVDELLRFPARQFWVEWFGIGECGRHQKIGALVEADPSGRRGSIIGYWQDESGRADTMGVSLDFDLDAAHLIDGLILRHAELPHVNRLLEKSRLRLDGSWRAFFRARRPDVFDQSMRDLAEGSWYHLPFLLAFAAMMNSEDIVDQQPSSLERLNIARQRRGRPRLLDHIEVRMRLQAPRTNAGNGAHWPHSRSSPRLHLVRGHFFRRGDKRYWRSSHLRGEAAQSFPRKTVLVSQAG
jgi:hypothetical protein